MRAVVLGGVAWNTLIHVESFPHPAPHTVFPVRTHQAVGGSGAGKALNLAHLGADVTLWALVGDDEPGDEIRAVVEDAGITFITERDPSGTARHVNLMDADGERISIFENPGSLTAHIDTSPVERILPGADLVSITIHDHCRAFLPVVSAAACDAWIDIHDYDGENPYHRDFIDAADYLFLSSTLFPGWRAFAESRIEHGATAVVCTHGPEGASGITAEGAWVEVAASPVDAFVDTNGAGDAFFAGFAVAWLADRDLEVAMRAGADQAALSISSPDLAPKGSGPEG